MVDTSHEVAYLDNRPIVELTDDPRAQSMDLSAIMNLRRMKHEVEGATHDAIHMLEMDGCLHGHKI